MKMPAAAIREEILKNGIISFARFMELALYCPETGYYETKKDNVGRGGDFITSVSTGSLFGELLAFQFAQWLAALSHGDGPLSIVEAGAHDAKLARDILTWLRVHRPCLFCGLEYVILEPSIRRQEWQRERLKEFASNVRWHSGFDASPKPCFNGVIFSNELLDAFPVHRFGWDAAAKSWFEWCVGLEGETFSWRKIELSGAGQQRLCPPELKQVLPDQYVVETSSAAEAWWRQAAASLAQGRLVAIDYGYAAAEIFSPARTRGTLRAYHRHHVSDDLLANPGEQDITAHVNFDTIQKTGEDAGLITEQFCGQPQFLTRILQQAVVEPVFAKLDSKQVRQFQTLTHPEHLGRAFRVLVQLRR